MLFDSSTTVFRIDNAFDAFLFLFFFLERLFSEIRNLEFKIGEVFSLGKFVSERYYVHVEEIMFLSCKHVGN